MFRGRGCWLWQLLDRLSWLRWVVDVYGWLVTRLVRNVFVGFNYCFDNLHRLSRIAPFGLIFYLEISFIKPPTWRSIDQSGSGGVKFLRRCARLCFCSNWRLRAATRLPAGEFWRLATAGKAFVVRWIHSLWMDSQLVPLYSVLLVDASFQTSAVLRVIGYGVSILVSSCW